MEPKIPEKFISVISPAGLLFTSGFVGRAAGGGSKFESAEGELKRILFLELSSLAKVRFGSGLGLVWVWFGSGLGLVWVWLGSGLGLVWV